MRIETVKITTTTVHELSVEGCTDLITRDWTGRRPWNFRPDRLRVEIVGGSVSHFYLSGPRVTARGESLDRGTNRYDRDSGFRTLGRQDAPEWAVEAAMKLDADR